MASFRRRNISKLKFSPFILTSSRWNCPLADEIDDYNRRHLKPVIEIIISPGSVMEVFYSALNLSSAPLNSAKPAGEVSNLI